MRVMQRFFLCERCDKDCAPDFFFSLPDLRLSLRGKKKKCPPVGGIACLVAATSIPQACDPQNLRTEPRSGIVSSGFEDREKTTRFCSGAE